jgi:hypothetical protein
MFCIMKGREKMKKIFFIGLLAFILIIPGIATADDFFYPTGPRDTQGIELEDQAPISWFGLVYNAVEPVRCLNTASAIGIVPGGSVVSILLDVACGVPFPAAKAVHVYIAAFNEFGAGNIRGFAWGDPVPNAAILNYGQIPGLFAIGNAVNLPLCGAGGCAADLSIFNSTTCNYTVDLLGYYTF